MTHTVADLDTHAEVQDATGRRVSRHDLISDAYAEAERLNKQETTMAVEASETLASDWNGLPENPERDGWHWVVAADPAISTESAPWWWNASMQHWLPPCDVSGALPLSPSRVQWRYLGPCLTPADLAARVEAERARAAAICDDDGSQDHTGCNPALVGPRLARAIRALDPTPAYDAAIQAAYKQGWNDREGDFLAGTARIGIDDAAIREAEARGMERAAVIAKRVGTHTDLNYGPCTNGLALQIAAAIRAAKDQPA